MTIQNGISRILVPHNSVTLYKLLFDWQTIAFFVCRLTMNRALNLEVRFSRKAHNFNMCVLPWMPQYLIFVKEADFKELSLTMQRVEDAFYTLVREIRQYRVKKISKEEKTPGCVKIKKCLVM